MSGPVTKNTDRLALGLAQLRVLASATNIGNIHPAGSASNSVGALTKTQFTAEREVWKHLSGFPQIEDYNITLSQKAMVEAECEELSPYNVALALGEDPSTYTKVHSGEVKLGSLTDIAYVRTELVYTFPDTAKSMVPIFPRAQVTSNVSLDFQATEDVKNPITVEAKRADSNVTGGNACWDAAPLGRIWFLSDTDD